MSTHRRAAEVVQQLLGEMSRIVVANPEGVIPGPARLEDLLRTVRI
jgi:hypothetical protein